MRLMFYVIFGIISGLWGFSYYGEKYWIADLLSNFAIQFILAFVLCAGLFLLVRHKTMVVISVSLALYIAAISLYPSYKIPAINACELCQTEEITIVQYNLKYDNPQINYVINWMLQDSEADVIVLQEADDHWKEKLFMLSIGFPYNLGDKEGFPDGLAVYSKIPLTFASFRKGSLSRSTYTRVGLQTPVLQIPIVLYNIHPVSPMQRLHWYMRNFHLLDVANEMTHEQAENRIVVGDFNTTQWSHWYKQAEKISGLRNAQNGYGFAISWSSVPYKPLIAGLHIDHMLVSSDIEIMQRSFAPDLGSDHLPVVTKIRVSRDMLKEYTKSVIPAKAGI